MSSTIAFIRIAAPLCITGTCMFSTYLLGLVLDTLNTRPHSINITKVLSTEGSNGTIGRGSGNDVHVVIKLINEGSAGGDVELGNIGLGDVIKMLDKSTEGVAMSGNDNVLAGLEVGDDTVLPVGEDTVKSGGKRLGKVIGKGVVGVTGIVGRVVLAGSVNSGGRNVVRTTPDEDLVLTVLVDGLLLV